MNAILVKTCYVLALLPLAINLWITDSDAASPEEILVWVSRQLNIEFVYDKPQIFFIDKQQLQNKFENFSQTSFAQWQARHGEAQARAIMTNYMEHVMGFFNPSTEAIYIGSFLSECSRQSVLAHEITHYFQHLINGPIAPDSVFAEDRRILREMEAYMIGNRFKAFFCDIDAIEVLDEKMLALLY